MAKRFDGPPLLDGRELAQFGQVGGRTPGVEGGPPLPPADVGRVLGLSGVERDQVRVLVDRFASQRGHARAEVTMETGVS